MFLRPRTAPIVVLAILALLLATSTSGQPTAPLGVQVDPRIREAVVMLRSPLGDGSYLRGSGTFISPQGYILTNLHVLSTDDGRVSDRVEVFVQSTATGATEHRYTAEYVAGDQSSDLAIVRVLADAEGRQIPGNFEFAFLPIGDPMNLNPGLDEVTVWGFPGVGGVSMTATRGLISGWLGETENETGTRWLKTDANINPGNSGGAALNSANQLVAVPTMQLYEEDESVVYLNYMRPVTLAETLLAEVPGVVYASPPIAQTVLMPGDEAELIRRATAGGTVQLGVGTYRISFDATREAFGVAEGRFYIGPDLPLEESVEIVGAGRGATVIQVNRGLVFSGSGDFSMRNLTMERSGGAPGDVIVIRGGSFELRSIDVMGGRYEAPSSPHGHGAGIRVVGSAVGVIRDSRVYGNGLTGIAIHAQARVDVLDSEVRGNGSDHAEQLDGHFALNARDDTPLVAGIAYFGEARGTVRGSTIEGNSGYGISITESARPEIANNRIRDNHFSGVVFDDQAGGELRDNFPIEGNRHLGVVVTGEATPSIEGNTVRNNMLSGIGIGDSAGGAVFDNTVLDNSSHGIVCDRQAVARIEGNTVRDNGGYAVTVEDSAACSVNGNDMAGNGSDEVYRWSGE